MENVYLIVKTNVNTKEEEIVFDKVYTSGRFAHQVATDLNNNAWDADKYFYNVKILGVEEFQTTEDLHEEEE